MSEAGRQQCRVCDRPAVARGLCMMHYKRARAGKPLVDRPVGEPSGFGLYGVLDVDDDSVLCHECGERFESVAGHLAAAHGMRAAEYKRRHGLPMTIALVSRDLSRRQSERARANLGSAGWRRLEEARDPVAASHARDDETFAAQSRTVRRTPERAVANGRAARNPRVVACPVCGAKWCPLPGGYGRVTCSRACWAELHRWVRLAAPRANEARDAVILQTHADGSSYADLARTYGITRERVGQIVRRRQESIEVPAAPTVGAPYLAWTDEDDGIVTDPGLSLRAMADRTGRSIASVKTRRRELRRAGRDVLAPGRDAERQRSGPRTRQYAAWSEEDDRIVTDATLTIQEMVARTGRSITAVRSRRKYLRQGGVHVPVPAADPADQRRQPSPHRGADLTSEQIEQLATASGVQEWADRARGMIAAGASQRSIARATGISTAAVSARLRGR